MKYLDKILKSEKTVFTYNDVKILLGLENIDTIKSLFIRFIKAGIFKNIYKGIYVLDKFDRFELGSKLKKNSYISFETVLKQNSIIFQDYSNTIFLSSDNTIAKHILGYNFEYNKIKNSILYNPLGIINKGNYFIATSERAICDRLYLSPNYYFDNLENVDKQKLLEISQIYNKRVILEVRKILEYVK